MTTLSATAVITAVDKASAVFARVGANARAVSGRFASAASGLNAFKGAALANLGIPAALGVASFGHNEAEWDRAAHQYRAIAELTNEQFDKVRQGIVKTSNATGVGRMELLEAAKGWQELGNAPESFIANMEVAAKVSRITGISVAEQMKESSAILRAFGGNVKDPAQYKHFEEVFLVASKGMKGGAEAFGEAMKSWSPVAAGLGLSFEQASALAQTLGGQFQAQEIGTALKTGFMRLAAPTPNAKAMLQAGGIDPADVFNYDTKKAGDAKALARGLKGTGSFTVTKDVESLIARDLKGADFSKGIDPVAEKLNKDLSHAFGGRGHKMSAQDRKILQAAILNHFSAAATGLDPEKFFKVFAPFANNVAFMSKVFGKEHAAKYMDLLKQMEHYEENLRNITEHSPGAIERKSAIMFEGFSFELQRMQANWQNLLGTVGGSGIKADLTSMAQGLTGLFESAQQADPEKLQKIFWAISAFAAAPLLGTGAAGITALALAFTDLSDAFRGELQLSLGPNGEVMNSQGPSVMTQNLTAMKDLFSEIGTSIAPITTAIKEMFNINPEGSLLIEGLRKIAEAINVVKSFVAIGNLSAKTEDAKAETLELKEKLAARPDYWASKAGAGDGGQTAGSLPPVDRFSFGANMPLIRDTFPEAGMQGVTVTGQANVAVQGEVTGNIMSQIRVLYEGPISGPSEVTGTAAVAGRLNPGSSNMDLEQTGAH